METLRQGNQPAGYGQAPSGQSVDCTNSINTTGEINYCGRSGGNVIIPTGSSITGLTFWGTDALGGTYVPIFNDTLATPTAVAISGATAPGGVPIPDACFGYAGLKIVTNASGTVLVTCKG